MLQCCPYHRLVDPADSTDFKARRWVVERTHSWMNHYRHVLTRWEKKFENYEAMLRFVCGVIVWNKILLG
ncbi:transposase [Salmonella enterica subsp. enterica serovar Sarajane]|nr:transposase [Salmonella enterica subsp. enterica serovar Sarajane]